MLPQDLILNGYVFGGFFVIKLWLQLHHIAADTRIASSQ